jgi:hypothetical protein
MMKQTKILTLMVVFLMSSLSFAQFGGLKDALGGGSSSSGGGNSLALQAELILGMSVAMNSFLKADAKFMDAIGLEGEAKKLRALVEEPSENDKKLGTKIEASREADKKMQKYIDSGKELSAQGKKDLADGLLPYAVGMASMIKMAKVAPEFLKASTDEIKSIKNPMQIMKIKKQFDLGIKTGKEVPGLFKKLGNSSKKLFGFAKANKIDMKKVQKDAKKAGVSDGIPSMDMD